MQKNKLKTFEIVKTFIFKTSFLKYISQFYNKNLIALLL